MMEPSFVPFPALTTSRLLLRAISQQDVDAIFALRTSPETLRFIDKKPLASKAEATLMIKKISDDVLLGEGITWGISLSANPDVLIGTIGLWKIMKEHYRAEIGYMLLPEYYKKGLMKEALAAVTDYGFNDMGLHSIEANINPANEASERLLISAGFVKEAHFKENYYFDGRFLDSVIYSLLNKVEI